MNKLDKYFILHKYCAVIKTSSGYDESGSPVGMNVPLKYILYDLPLMLKDWLLYVEGLEYHSPEQNEAKNKSPRYYISGMYDMNEFNYGRFPIHDYPIKESNLMCIDIDAKDNEDVDIWKLREEIFKLPYVFSCLKSVSGKGFYCIIPIENTRYTKEYYKYIARLWKKKFNINVDDNASSLVRARIISYNEDIDNWIKDQVDEWNLKYVEKEEEIKESSGLYDYRLKNIRDDKWEEIAHKAMRMVINNGYFVNGYNAWFHLGCECRNFDDGEELFIKASKNVNYNDDINIILKKFNNCSPSGIDNDFIRKWCGMAKNRFGKDWIKMIDNQ